MRHTSWTVIAVVLVLAGCESTPTPPKPTTGTLVESPRSTDQSVIPSAASSGQVTESASPPQTQPTGGPAATSAPLGPTPPIAPAGLLLTEVLVAPAEGAFPFIEISNVGTDAIALAGMHLRINDAALRLGTVAAPLAPGEQVLVWLDETRPTDGRTIHASGGFTLARDQGVVELLDADADVLDRVAWGDGQPNTVSVSTGSSGRILDPGTSIGRPPGANAPGHPEAWVTFRPAATSPGTPNPMPSTDVLLPLSGAVLEGNSAVLSWYPVPVAAGYRVQIALDEAFASLVLDATVTEPQVDPGSLAPARYFWRVIAVSASGAESAASETSTFETTGPVALAAGVLGAAASAAKELPVPLLTQHKDTAMLLLEDPIPEGPRAWDNDHGSTDRGDPADNKNCANAAIAMVNRFFGGDMSQDRIGYEILHAEGGPEGDLQYGRGLFSPEITKALTFALGAAPRYLGPGIAPDRIWAEVTASIDAGRPVVAAGAIHTFVFTGYSTAGGRRLLSVNDPWTLPSTYRYDVDAVRPASLNRPALLELWLLAAGSVGRQQEASIKPDSDGDGVVDFDEIERFHTNPNAADSDGDKVPDKADIASGIFDATFGYALNRLNPGRDFDADTTPTERDRDSDSGGCPDGEEDLDRNGVHEESPETWNFDPSDDDRSNPRCELHDAFGTLTYTRSYSLEHSAQNSSSTEKLTVNVKLRGDPDSDVQSFIDDGSTYAYSSSYDVVLFSELCDLTTTGIGSGGGDLAKENGVIHGGVVQDTFNIGLNAPYDVVTTIDYCVFVERGRLEDDGIGLPNEDQCRGTTKDTASPRRYTIRCDSEHSEVSVEGLHWTLTGTITVP